MTDFKIDLYNKVKRLRDQVKRLEYDNIKMKAGLLEILEEIPPNASLSFTLLIKSIAQRSLRKG